MPGNPEIISIIKRLNIAALAIRDTVKILFEMSEGDWKWRSFEPVLKDAFDVLVDDK